MKPLRDLVFIEPFFEVKEQFEKAGLIMPEYGKNVLPFQGKVTGIGPNVKDVKVGDTVIFDRFRADNLKDKGYVVDGNANIIIIKEELILAIIHE